MLKKRAVFLHALFGLILLLALQGRVLHAWSHLDTRPDAVKEHSTHHVCELCLGFSGLDSAPLTHFVLPAVRLLPQPTIASLYVFISLAEKPPFHSRAPPYFS